MTDGQRILDFAVTPKKDRRLAPRTPVTPKPAGLTITVTRTWELDAQPHADGEPEHESGG